MILVQKINTRRTGTLAEIVIHAFIKLPPIASRHVLISDMLLISPLGTPQMIQLRLQEPLHPNCHNSSSPGQTTSSPKVQHPVPGYAGIKYAVPASPSSYRRFENEHRSGISTPTATHPSNVPFLPSVKSFQKCKYNSAGLYSKDRPNRGYHSNCRP